MTAPLHGLLSEDPVVATAGVGLFADALRDQAVPVTEGDWMPPMEGTERHLVTVLADRRRAEANALAFARMTAAGADLVDVRPARDAVGLERGTFLHAGPPIEWERASGPMRGALIGAVLFEGLGDARFYFVHSYAARRWELEPDPTGTIEPPLVTWAEHGDRFVAAVENGPLCATQFHPEKSGDAGARLLRNWLSTLS